jgi:hypothetical protein
MMKKRFWDIIAASRAGFDPQDIDGSMDRQVARLHELLSALSVEEVRGFAKFFDERMTEAYSRPKRIKRGRPLDGLWAVAYDIGGGCSDDGFDDFRSWLISMGQEVYEAVLRAPKKVYEVVEKAGLEDEVFFEELQYVPSRVLREKTGEEE